MKGLIFAFVCLAAAAEQVYVCPPEAAARGDVTSSIMSIDEYEQKMLFPRVKGIIQALIAEDNSLCLDVYTTQLRQDLRHSAIVHDLASAGWKWSWRHLRWSHWEACLVSTTAPDAWWFW